MRERAPPPRQRSKSRYGQSTRTWTVSTDSVCVSRQSTAGRIAKVCGTSAVFSRRKMEEPRQKRKKKKGKEGRKQVDGDVLATRDRLSLSLWWWCREAFTYYTVYMYTSQVSPFLPFFFAFLAVCAVLLQSISHILFRWTRFFSFTSLRLSSWWMNSLYVGLYWRLASSTRAVHTHTHTHKTQTVHSFLAMRANPPSV